MTFADDARAYAEAWNDHADHEFNNGNEAAFGVDDESFVAGALWAREQEPTEAQVEAAARAMDENFNPDKYPVMSAMFADYARVALLAAKEEA